MHITHVRWRNCAKFVGTLTSSTALADDSSVTKVITTRYAAGYSSTLEDMTEVGEKLLAFRQNVPALLQYTYVDCTSQRGLWSAMLAMAIK